MFDGFGSWCAGAFVVLVIFGAIIGVGYLLWLSPDRQGGPR